MSIEAMKLALAALELTPANETALYQQQLQARVALRQAIEQAEQAQPEACPYCRNFHTLGAVYFDQNCAGCVKRMTAPPQIQPCAGRNCGSTDPNLHSAECFEDYERSTGMATQPVAWQWLDTPHFRKHLPKDAEPGVWRPLYAAPTAPVKEQT